ncbi:Uncharacterized protein FWK35_00020874 [Aphis craccivora]|uniref:Integrase zinc-binding domain-containing protein n=1 Tax=Aphis craccivora TaxID=307492 RepID=A0A6G0Y9X5_APHCR|nr:Uncharacterized protein FWK35_00020874 [Aphis craccivora]
MYSIKEIKDESYTCFLEKSETTIITNSNVKEVNGELLESPAEYHIVSEIEKYYNFKSGINYKLKRKFGTDKILESSKQICDVAYFNYKKRYIIFLITKSKEKRLATSENINFALLNLKHFCIKNSLNKLAINQIGKKDGLDWTKTRSMIRYIFRNINIEIIICIKLEYTSEEKLIIVKQFHDSLLGGHAGLNRIVKKFKRQFNWPGLKQEVRDYIKNCPSCQTNKIINRHHRSPMIITTTSSKPFEKIFLDIVGPLLSTAIGITYY